MKMEKRHGPSAASASSSSCSSSDSAPPACGLPGRKDTPSPKDGCSTVGDDSYSTCIADAFREKKRKEKSRMGRKETKDGRNGGGGSKVDAGDLKVGVYLYRRQSTLDVAIRRSRSPARTSLLFYFFQCKKKHMKTPSRNLFQANSQSKQH